MIESQRQFIQAAELSHQSALDALAKVPYQEIRINEAKYNHDLQSVQREVSNHNLQLCQVLENAVTTLGQHYTGIIQVSSASLSNIDQRQSLAYSQYNQAISQAETRQTQIESEQNRVASLEIEYQKLQTQLQTDTNGNNVIHLAVKNARNIALKSADLPSGQEVFCPDNITIDADITLGSITFNKGKDGYTIHEQKTLNLINYMIDRDVDPHAQNNLGMTAFMLSCAHRHEYLSKKLLEQPDLVDLSKVDNSGFDNFLWALELKDTGILQKLLQLGSDINIQDHMGRTPLYWMSLYNNPELIEFLVTKGADQLITDKEGIYPVHIAASKGHIESLKSLLKQDQDRSILDKTTDNANQITPLWIASQNDQSEVVNYLIGQNADVNIARSNTGLTPLHTAITQNQLDIVEQLLSISDATQKDSNGNNALMHSLLLGNVKIIKSLLEQDIDPNCINNNGISPLLFTVIKAQTGPIDLLLSYGANPNIAVGSLLVNGVNISGKTPLEIMLMMTDIGLQDKINIIYKHLEKLDTHVLVKYGVGVPQNAKPPEEESNIDTFALDQLKEIKDNDAYQAMFNYLDSNLHDEAIEDIKISGLSILQQTLVLGAKDTSSWLINTYPILLRVMDQDSKTGFEYVLRYGDNEFIHQIYTDHKEYLEDIIKNIILSNSDSDAAQIIRTLSLSNAFMQAGDDAGLCALEQESCEPKNLLGDNPEII